LSDGDNLLTLVAGDLRNSRFGTHFSTIKARRMGGKLLASLGTAVLVLHHLEYLSGRFD
jgi:hypothetical protein